MVREQPPRCQRFCVFRGCRKQSPNTILSPCCYSCLPSSTNKPSPLPPLSQPSPTLYPIQCPASTNGPMCETVSTSLDRNRIRSSWCARGTVTDGLSPPPLDAPDSRSMA
ncbi:hypothetical protein SKAU_G00363270 [Synaphobranchus kaupii]|uniref:Uncharacterized protein n=1 Tax=Synaphobranchus kaupii TaxID=118154 RepID=A0A9Q1IHB1_SYNKA|nr:hypothetical protein SKAU_G00363270 [Synaphobranchus kaupii]